MYLGGENGTEVPMYSSVGTEDNGGNMVSVNWNTAEDEDGNLVAWPSVNEAKMEDIGKFLHFSSFIVRACSLVELNLTSRSNIHQSPRTSFETEVQIY